MKKIKITAFLKEFFIPNVVFYFAYLLVTTLVNMFFGNATLEFATDVATGGEQNVFLTVLYSLLQLGAFVGFYVYSMVRLERDSEEKRAFLAALGTEKFDPADFSGRYFSERGKYMLTYFSVTCGILTIARMIGVPFSLMLVFSQSMLSSVLGLLIGGKSAVISIVLILVTYVINVLIYFVYQRFVCVKVYEKWAEERLRVR